MQRTTTAHPADLDPHVQQVTESLQSKAETVTVSIDGHDLTLTHLAKPLWQVSPVHPEETTLSKRDLLMYYTRMAPFILPCLKDRPLTVKRFPEGVDGPSFVQRHVPGLPAFAESVDICVDTTGNNEPFLLCQNLATLLWLVNLDVIEFHPWHSRINPEHTGLPTIFINSMGTLEMSVLNYPDWLIFDIDPSNTETGDQAGGSLGRAKTAAKYIGEYLEDKGLASLLKLSGKRGLHVIVPLVRQYPFEEVRNACRTLCEELVERHDDIFTTEWHIEKRQGRIFLDWQQNARGKSQAAAYSVRATEKAAISAPIEWHDLESIEAGWATIESVSRQLVPMPRDFAHRIAELAQPLPDSVLH